MKAKITKNGGIIIDGQTRQCCHRMWGGEESDFVPCNTKCMGYRGYRKIMVDMGTDKYVMTFCQTVGEKVFDELTDEIPFYVTMFDVGVGKSVSNSMLTLQ